MIDRNQMPHLTFRWDAITIHGGTINSVEEAKAFCQCLDFLAALVEEYRRTDKVRPLRKDAAS